LDFGFFSFSKKLKKGHRPLAPHVLIDLIPGRMIKSRAAGGWSKLPSFFRKKDEK